MTEDDAKTKACCGSAGTAWATIATAYAAAGNAELVPEAPKCIGSACMAWRWSRKDTEALKGEKGAFRRGFGKEHGYEVEGDLPDLGHCGLAGAPQ